MKALITDIQRFSLSDGTGIRTTVFLKGCNMHCTWCHNPETLSNRSELMFYETKCIGCGKCFEVCPKGAHKIIDENHVIDRNLCVSCGKCAEVCYAEALVMCGKPMTVDDVMKQIVQDKAYYDNSNGGVTISGGEVLCNIEFATELAKACKAEGINVAIETNLSVPLENAQCLIDNLDMVMCDIKIFDNEKHKEYTGISNSVVLDNIKKLDELNIPFIVRTPLIPHVTDSEENIEQIADYIKGLKNLVRYEMLNFNPLGEGKYKSLNRTNDFEKERPLSEDRLERLKKIAEGKGITVKVI